MKLRTQLRLLALLLITLTFIPCQAQEEKDYFITVWDLSLANDNAFTNIEFYALTSGEVNYTWETIPAGTSGAGKFSANNSKVTISNLPSKAKIKLKLASENLKRFYFESSFTLKLIDVMQWGKVAWTSMEKGFYNCHNLNITATDVPDLSSVSSMKEMFRGCNKLTTPNNINNWNTQNVSDMSLMFSFASSFNQSIGSWNTQNVTNMRSMFWFASSFNQPIGSWNTQNVQDMRGMFSWASAFNQPIGSWNTQNVLDMGGMFSSASTFNQPIGSWNTKNVNTMISMFYRASSFNQPIGSWNTQNVTTMSSMFTYAKSFNQPIDSWNTVNVTDMSSMFSEATSFNQPIGSWNTQNVTDMRMMFYYATSFNQRLDSLELNPKVNFDALDIGAIFINNCGIDCKNYSYTLIGWANNPNTPNNIKLGVSGINYSNAALASRTLLTKPVSEGGKGWTIVGDALATEDCGLITSSQEAMIQEKLYIYPNPAQNILYVKNASKATPYKIIDAMGRLQSTGILDEAGISLSGLPSGLYTLLFDNQHFTFVKEE